jgi:hypothetical protein
MVNAWDRNGGRYGVSIRPDGTFLLWLEEGEYRISANVPKTHVVKSMSFGSRDLTKNPLVVQAATFEEIRIVIAEK